ncbi:hypothetical protein BH23VER1_BH23VER1_37330 [soil metagenome]
MRQPGTTPIFLLGRREPERWTRSAAPADSPREDPLVLAIRGAMRADAGDFVGAIDLSLQGCRHAHPRCHSTLLRYGLNLALAGYAPESLEVLERAAGENHPAVASLAGGWSVDHFRDGESSSAAPFDYGDRAVPPLIVG